MIHRIHSSMSLPAVRSSSTGLRLRVALLSVAMAQPLPATAASRSHATGVADGAAVIGTNRKLEIAPGVSRMVELPQDASEVFVANPAIANVVVRSPRKIYIVAVNVGQTSIYAMDRDSRQIASFQINVQVPEAPPAPLAGLSELNSIMRLAVPRGHISVKQIGSSVVLTGTVHSAGDAAQALDIARGFLGNIQPGSSTTTSTSSPGQASSSTLGNSGSLPVLNGQVVNALTIEGKDQVMLKVSVVEIQRNIIKQLGVNTSGQWTKSTNCTTPPCNAASINTIANLANSITNTTQFGASTTLQQSLQAFERYGVSRVLAEPTVTAVSGESAKFTAGGEIPVIGALATQAGGIFTAPSITYKQYGVTLNFSPVVLSEGRILLRLATEVTEIDSANAFTYQGSSIPAFLTRKNETTVELPSGGSIISAGLLQTNTRQIVSGLPGAMNLPILGSLFRSRDYQRNETELMIVVTPYIAKALNPDEITRPDDNLAEASDPQTVFLGRVNRLYSTTRNPQALSNYKGRVGFIND